MQKVKAIKCFGREIYGGVIILNDAFEEQINLKNDINKFSECTKPKSPSKKVKKVPTLENV